MSRIDTEPLSGHDTSLLERSAESRALGYLRFLDLQAAEERAARSAREAACERVRSAVLASRSADDILAVSSVVERELRELGVRVAACSIDLIDEGAAACRPQQGDLAELERSHAARVAIDVPLANGTLAMSSASGEGFSQDEIEILQGFADVISPAYTRYLDFERVEQQNRALAAANQRIREGTERKSEFLRRVSHDLRTPMNAIIGYTRILLRRAKGVLDDRQYRNLVNIQTSAAYLLGLINEVLDLSRIEDGDVDLRPEPVDLGQLVGDCITAVAPLVKPGVQLVQDLGNVPELTTDADRLRRVVMNLLGNAVKFTERGSIRVSLKTTQSGFELAVADTGVGIPAEDLPHIFAEYRQVERGVGEKTEGTGLGLAIAAKSAEVLGGTISADSELGVGSTFTLRIGDYPWPAGPGMYHK